MYRIDQLRSMAMANRSSFMQYAKQIGEEDQMWRSIYQCWNYRYASDRKLVPSDVDEDKVEGMIEKNFRDAMAKHREITMIAKEMHIDLNEEKKVCFLCCL